MQNAAMITALITPFNESGVDITGLKNLIVRQIQNGADAILVLGTTGEAPTISPEERKTVVAAAAEVIAEAAPTVALIVGTGTYATTTTLQFTREARDLGADAALVATPYYNCPEEEGIYRHFEALTEAELPLILYHHPKRCGVALSIEAIKAIASLPGVVGIKEASGNMDLSANILHHCKDFRFWTGNDTQVLPAMALGAEGLFSVAGNIIPKEMVSIVRAASAGDWAEAREIFYALLPLIQSLFVEVNPIPVKAAAELCGLAAGPCRLPLSSLSAEHKAYLQEVLERYELTALIQERG